MLGNPKETSHSPARSGRLELIIPGYSGFIPSSSLPKESVSPQKIEGGHIPGYAGYVPKIKPENLFGKTFGTITEGVNKGAEVASDPLLTTSQQIFVDQNGIRQKTAAESVGVVRHKTEFRKPNAEELNYLSQTLQRVDHQSSCHCQDLKENCSNSCNSANLSGSYQSGLSEKQKCSKKVTFVDSKDLGTSKDSSDSNVRNEEDIDVQALECSDSDHSQKLMGKSEHPHTKDKKPEETKTFIGGAVPGYTGHRRKIYADNVYGKTFKTCEKIATKLLNEAEEKKMMTLEANQGVLPPLHRTTN